MWLIPFLHGRLPELGESIPVTCTAILVLSVPEYPHVTSFLLQYSHGSSKSAQSCWLSLHSTSYACNGLLHNGLLRLPRDIKTFENVVESVDLLPEFWDNFAQSNQTACAVAEILIQYIRAGRQSTAALCEEKQQQFGPTFNTRTRFGR